MLNIDKNSKLVVPATAQQQSGRFF